MQKLFGCTNPQFHLSGWQVADHPVDEEAECGGPGLAWLHVVCGCEASWTYCQILKNDDGEVAYGREMNIKLSDNSIPIAHALNFRHLWHCVV